MSEEKNIDRLFQEKLKDFEVTPSDAVWTSIADRIQPKKKKRRVVPLWIRLSGVAAGLLLLISLSTVLFNNDDNTLPIDNTPIVNENGTSQDEALPNNNTDLNTTTVSKDDEANNLVEPYNNTSREEQSIANKNNKSKNQLANKESNKDQRLKTNEAKVALKDEIETTKTDGIAAVTNTVDQQNTTEEITKDEVLKDLIDETDTKKESIIEAITTTEEALAENDEVNKSSRWSVSPNLAPVYFNSLGEGSSIHSDFNNNPKSGDVNMSYGITASYALNDKLSVRTGVNKVQLGYSTDEILVFNSLSSSIRSSKYRNIDLNRTANDMSFASASTFEADDTPFFVTGKNASIDQQLGFLEVPLELEYKLLDKKLGIHVVGGFSALFLESNNLYSVLDGQSSLIGKATNINKTSYSANLGLGLGYKMSNKLNLNLEPVFKYQLNTFTNTSGDFRPYFVGFYTGLSFKF